MRSQAFLRRSRVLLRSSQSLPTPVSLFPTRSARTDPATRLRASLRTPGRRPLSSDVGASSEPTAGTSAPDGNDPTSPPKDPVEPEPEATTTISSIKGKTSRSKPDAEQAELPPNLDVFWIPQDATSEAERVKLDAALPPPEIFDSALNNLHIALHPQTQHRAAYPSANSRSAEPTLALYCPIEGGDYIIDATVGEMARRTGADVLVLDAVQLAAGEWGAFGKG